VIQAGPTAVPVVADAAAWLDGCVEIPQAAAMARWQLARGDLAARGARSADARHQSAAHLGALWQGLTGGRASEAGYEGLAALDASRRAWTLWWQGETPETDE